MKRLAVAAMVGLALAGGSPSWAKKPEMTPMELQAIQSKEFEATKDDAFAALMTVFQDLGYQVASADVNSGFITTESATRNKTNVFEAFAGMASSGSTRATTFIQKLANGNVRIRLNFLNVKSSSSAYGRASKNDRPILDPRVYSTAWDKIEEALFVNRATNSPSTSIAAPAAPSQAASAGAGSAASH